MISKNAVELCSKILISLGFGNETLMSLIQKWRSFIEECQDGYGWDYSEYRNEIRSRFLIQQLLENPKIANADEFKGYFEELAYLDEIFRSLLQPGVSVSEGENWWERGVLIRAREEYCYYMNSAHGVVVESVDG